MLLTTSAVVGTAAVASYGVDPQRDRREDRLDRRERSKRVLVATNHPSRARWP